MPKQELLRQRVKELSDKIVYKISESFTTTTADAFVNEFYLCTGVSACADPAKFNAELGRDYAIKDAREKAIKELYSLEAWRIHMEG